MPPIEFLADRHEAGKTIAAILRDRFKMPWSQAQRVVMGGHVRVAGFVTRDPGHRMKAKNRVWVREGVIEMKVLRKKPKPKVKPPVVKVPVVVKPKAVVNVPGLPADVVVYADDAVIVANKPAGLTTMRHAEEVAEFGAGKKFLPKTLAELLPAAIGKPNAKLVPVHRIDRDTSGLVVFARTKKAAGPLTTQFRKHTVERRYVALVRGTPVDGKIDSILVKDRGDGRRGSSATPTVEDGKRAVTHVTVLERFTSYTLVECRLETGRTHQVRIHLGEAGTPLCGETVYDRPLNGSPVADGSGADRPMLHAARLGFKHPLTGEVMSWDVPPPSDFAKLKVKLKGKKSGSA